MESQSHNNVNPDVRFDNLELIDVPRMVRTFNNKWFIQTLTNVNDSAILMCLVKGEPDWHKHDDHDEFIYVMRGKLYLEYETHTVELRKQQAISIPKGVMHRTMAPKKTILLRIEPKGNKTTCGDENWIDPIIHGVNYTYPFGISIDTTIEDLQKFEGISVRSLNICHSVNVRTIKDLLAFLKDKRNNFALVRNCGKMSDKELVDLGEKYRNYPFSEEV